jgi:hypothetical protein
MEELRSAFLAVNEEEWIVAQSADHIIQEIRRYFERGEPSGGADQAPPRRLGQLEIVSYGPFPEA